MKKLRIRILDIIMAIVFGLFFLSSISESHANSIIIPAPVSLDWTDEEIFLTSALIVATIFFIIAAVLNIKVSRLNARAKRNSEVNSGRD